MLHTTLLACRLLAMLAMLLDAISPIGFSHCGRKRFHPKNVLLLDLRDVVLDESVSKVSLTGYSEVDREKGEICGNVTAPISRSKLDAVDDDRIRYKGHVLRAKVAVTVADEPLRHPSFKTFRMERESPELTRSNCGVTLRADQIADGVHRLVEVFYNAPSEIGDRSVALDV